MVAEGGEGENPLPPLHPKRGRGWGGGGGDRGGFPASFPSRSPPPKQPFQPTPTPSPGSHQEVWFGWFLWGKGPWAGPQARPTGPWGPPLSAVDFLQTLTSCCVSNPWIPGLKTLGYHNPQSADLGGRWMVSEGYSPMRGGSRLRSSISGGSKPLGTWPTSP